MKRLSEVLPGQQFYFPKAPGIIFTMHEHLVNILDEVTVVKTYKSGKLYATYFRATMKVAVVGEKQITLKK